MPAYATLMMKINDYAEYKKYQDVAIPLAKQYGGKFLTRGHPVTNMEGGEYKDTLALVEFPNKKAAQDYFADPEYQKIVSIRHGCTTTHHWMLQEAD